MARDNRTRESKITTNREKIHDWVSDSEVVPARRTDESEPEDLTIVRKRNLTDDHEQLSWEEFYDELDDSDQVVLAHDDGSFEVVDRESVTSRATVESEEIEQALLEGETVTSEITETTVIERTVVEAATVESEVVDRERVEDDYADAERLNRTVQGCDVAAEEDARSGTVDFDQFEPGASITDAFEVDVTVDERWRVTKDQLDRVTIESRVVDTEHTETDTVEADEIESTVDVEGVQEQILESDLVESDVTTTDVIESGAIESDFAEDNVITTQLLERKTVESELAVEKLFTGEITEGETLRADTDRTEIVDSDIVHEEPESVSATSEPSTAGATAGSETERLEPTADDEGKDVVDASGEKIGMAVEVQENTVYVEPHPSLADRIKTALDWGEPEGDTYPIDRDQIARITDDEIQLEIEE